MMRRNSVFTFSLLIILQIVLSSGCQLEADIALLIDTSYSILFSNRLGNNFGEVKNFTRDLATKLAAAVNSDSTRIAAAVFGSSSSVLWDLTTYAGDEPGLQTAIQGMTCCSGITNAGLGLAVTRTQVFNSLNGDRPGVQNILIKITDGKASDLANYTAEVPLIQSVASHVFVVGIGSNLDVTQMSLLASDPDITYLYQSPDFSSLSSIFNSLYGSLCSVAGSSTTTSTTTSSTTSSTTSPTTSSTTSPTTSPTTSSTTSSTTSPTTSATTSSTTSSTTSATTSSTTSLTTSSTTSQTTSSTMSPTTSAITSSTTSPTTSATTSSTTSATMSPTTSPTTSSTTSATTSSTTSQTTSSTTSPTTSATTSPTTESMILAAGANGNSMDDTEPSGDTLGIVLGTAVPVALAALAGCVLLTWLVACRKKRGRKEEDEDAIGFVKKKPTTVTPPTQSPVALPGETTVSPSSFMGQGKPLPPTDVKVKEAWKFASAGAPRQFY